MNTSYHLFISHFSLLHLYIYLFFPLCTPQGSFAPFLSPFLPADLITPPGFPSCISPLPVSIHFSPRNCQTQERSMEVPMLDDLASVRILPVAMQHCLTFELEALNSIPILMHTSQQRAT